MKELCFVHQKKPVAALHTQAQAMEITHSMYAIALFMLITTATPVTCYSGVDYGLLLVLHGGVMTRVVLGRQGRLLAVSGLHLHTVLESGL